LASNLVVNASPIILLAKIDGLHLLQALGEEILVPRTVIDEVRAGGVVEAALDRDEVRGWLTTVEDVNIPASILEWDLGPGESQVIGLVMQHGDMWAVLDDRRARRCAEAHGVRHLGTLGVTLACKRRGVIPEVKPLLDRLRQTGMYLDDELYAHVLSRAGESGK
jgi:predicted nucleic acid-binding protein